MARAEAVALEEAAAQARLEALRARRHRQETEELLMAEVARTAREAAQVHELAAAAALDLERFERDLNDPRILERLARDHQQAVEEHGVFGTPTFVFPGASVAYVRMMPAPEGSQAVKLFDELVSVIASEPALLEIKRPRP
jgi:2-hydroxychromene-2-carboxylate isomerase